jgi:cell division protein FtsB
MARYFSTAANASDAAREATGIAAEQAALAAQVKALQKEAMLSTRTRNGPSST